MKLIFVHIVEHKILKNISIPFSSEFNCLFDGKNLSIQDNPEYLPDYYEGLNISAIIGNNGSGKTSILEFIENRKEYSESIGFLVWIENNGSFIYETINFITNINFDLCRQFKSNYLTENKFFEIVKINNISDLNFSKKINKGEVTDFTSEYINKTKTRRTKHVKQMLEYLQSDYWERNVRVSYSFKYSGWSTTIKSWIKERLLVKFSESKNPKPTYFLELYGVFLSSQDRVRLSSPPTPIPSNEYNKICQRLVNRIISFIEQTFISLTNENTFDSTKQIILFKNSLTICRRTLLKSDIDMSLGSQIDIEIELCFNLISLFLHHKRIDEDILSEAFESTINFFSSNPYSDVYINKNIKFIENIIFEIRREFTEDFIVTDKFLNQTFHLNIKTNTSTNTNKYNGIEEYTSNTAFDIFETISGINSLPTYLQNNIDYGWNGLSSGEFAKASVFSCILNSVIKNRISYKLIVIDEADLYLHPEWQRLFVSDLISMMTKLETVEKVQFIITTHSPLIIGDLLPEDVITLKVIDRHPITVDSLSFGTKLSDAYLEGMHLKSTFGEHSRSKLQELIDKKMKGKTLTGNHKKLAEKIGNLSLRGSLLDD